MGGTIAKLTEALSTPGVISGDLWARPRAWKGSGQAVAVSGGRLLCVPSAHGGLPWVPRLADLTGEWEVLSPDEVLEEKL